MKKRHKWNEIDEKNDLTLVYQCVQCGIYKFNAIGKTFYSWEKLTNSNSVVDVTPNIGCNQKKVL